jgi:hypothetical protein
MFSLAKPHHDNNKTYVDVLVAAGGIPSWTTFLREEEDSKKSKEDH